MTDLTSLVAEDVTLDSVKDLRPNLPTDRDNNYSGRRAFVEAGTICDIHPEFQGVTANADNPCAKFGHLPGNGRGIHQPRWTYYLKRLFVTGIKPILFLTVIGSGYFFLHNGFGHTGSGILRPANVIPSTACKLPNVNGQSQNSGIPANSRSRSCIPASGPSHSGSVK